MRAALGVATTVTGLGPPCYEPAPLGGGGLVDAPAAVMEAMFRDAATGILYTPPRFSDHAAVSCLMLDGLWNAFPKPSTPTAAAAALRGAQPHKLTAPITQFFKTAGRQHGGQDAAGDEQGAKRAVEARAGDGCGADGQKRRAIDEGNTSSGKKVEGALQRLFHFGSKTKE